MADTGIENDVTATADDESPPEVQQAVLLKLEIRNKHGEQKIIEMYQNSNIQELVSAIARENELDIDTELAVDYQIRKSLSQLLSVATKTQ